MKRLLLLLTAVLLLCCGCQKARGDVEAVSCDAEAPAATSADDTTTAPDKATIPYSATQAPTDTTVPRVVPSGETTRKNLDGENTSAADVQQPTQDFSPPQNWKPPRGDPRSSTPDSTTATAYTHNDDPEESVEFWFPALRDARYCEDIILWDAYYHMVQYPKFCNHTVTDFAEKHIPSNEPGIETIQVTLHTEVGDYTVTFTQNGQFIKDNQ